MAENYLPQRGVANNKIVELQSADASRDPSVVLQSVESGDELNDHAHKTIASNDANTLGLTSLEDIYHDRTNSLSQSSILKLQGSPYDVKAIRERNAARQNRQFQWQPRVMSRKDSHKNYNQKIPFYVCLNTVYIHNMLCTTAISYFTTYLFYVDSVTTRARVKVVHLKYILFCDWIVGGFTKNATLHNTLKPKKNVNNNV